MDSGGFISRNCIKNFNIENGLHLFLNQKRLIGHPADQQTDQD
ncbi:hypothetical protein Asch01_01503 [Acinetobacter schindleri]